MYDLAVKNGRIVDGTGNPWFRANIGVSEGRIAEISHSGSIRAKRVIDARGLVVMPGVVDVHSHSDQTLLTYNRAENRVRQGITTDAVGSCGFSSYAFNKKFRETMKGMLRFWTGREYDVDWLTLAEWGDRLGKIGVGVNVVPLVGFGTVRRSVMGEEGEGGERNEPTDSELKAMRRLVEGGMRDGAFGITSGLEYVSQRNAYTEELIELCRAVSDRGGVYTSHIRSEDDYVVEAVEEFIRICREAEIPGCISHHKACSSWNWGKPKETIRLLSEARADGVDVICDTYPWLYVAVRNVGLFFLKPGEPFDDAKRGELKRSFGSDKAWAKIRAEAVESFEQERSMIEETRKKLESHGTPGRIPWDPVVYFIIAYSKTRPDLEGRNFTEAARAMGMGDPWDAVRRLYLADDGSTTVAMGSMSEEDLVDILRAPFTAVSTDGHAEDEPRSLHPRAYGTYPLLFERYVREKGVLGLEEAVRRVTSLPAGFLGLGDRGLLREGFWADIVVFDPSTIRNRATYAEPCLYPEGISHVLVSGEPVVKGGKYLGTLNGRVLKRAE